MARIVAIAGICGRIIAELVAPTRCVACEVLVGPRVLFCEGCTVAVTRATTAQKDAHAVFEYGGAVATAIVRFKYAGRSDLAGRLAAVMADATVALSDIEAVVPVPLHERRLVERGYDQAALLAAPVARRLRAPFVPRALVRTRETPPQASLDRAARGANVARAFRASSPAKAKIEQRHVLLVDDVRTTGATLASCADALRAAGASRVTTLVLARRDRARVGEICAHDDG